MYQQGKQSLDRGDYNSAIEIFSKALQLLPAWDRNTQAVVLARATAYYKKGDLKRAFEEADKVLRTPYLDGDTLASGLNLRGVLHSVAGRHNEALKDYTSAIKATHDDLALRSASFANRGKVFIELGAFDKALGDFSKAIELDPSSAFPYAGRGLAYLRMSNIEKARTEAQTALSMNPDQQTAKLAQKVLNSLTFSYAGPNRISVPIGDDGHVFVQVRFGAGGKPRRFLLDTGATQSLISKDLMESIRKETQVTPLGQGRAMTADGATHPVTRYLVKDAFLFNLPLGDIEVVVFSGKQPTYANLLGANSLKQLSISINTASRKAEIRRVDSNVDQGED
jgi:tetratricopeptide (TPR) repeat protein